MTQTARIVKRLWSVLLLLALLIPLPARADTSTPSAVLTYTPPAVLWSAPGAVPVVVYHPAPRLLPAVVAGVNEDIGELVPRSPYYLATPAGDLFDLMASAGIGVVRLTEHDASAASGAPPAASALGSWSAGDFRYVAMRAQMTGIKLLPLFEQAIITSVDGPVVSPNAARCPLPNGDNAQRLKGLRWTWLLSNVGWYAAGVVYGVDLGNETDLSGQTVVDDRAITSYLHCAYPGLKVTVGGWQSGGAYNDPTWPGYPAGDPSQADGAGSLAIGVDFISAHLYHVVTGYHQQTPFEASSPAAVYTGTLAALHAIATWAPGVPIMLQEFGAASGDFGRNYTARGGVYSEAHQAAVIESVGRAIVAARRQNIPALGGLAWILTERTPWLGQNGPGNKASVDALIGQLDVPGHLHILPGFYALCRGLSALPCPQEPLTPTLVPPTP